MLLYLVGENKKSFLKFSDIIGRFLARLKNTNWKCKQLAGRDDLQLILNSVKQRTASKLYSLLL